jgi:hypothetical protein
MTKKSRDRRKMARRINSILQDPLLDNIKIEMVEQAIIYPKKHPLSYALIPYLDKIQLKYLKRHPSPPPASCDNAHLPAE